jgi:hypothetical protein
VQRGEQLLFNGLSGAAGEWSAKRIARSLGETVIESQVKRGAVETGFDFLSFTGKGSAARLFINEVKKVSGAVAATKFSTLGLGRSGRTTLRQALDDAEAAIIRAGLDDLTTRTLVAQLRSGANVRLIGRADTIFNPHILEQIGSATGLITGQGFWIP